MRVLTSWGLSISIHALRKESDHHEVVVPVDPVISIHALRKESDSRKSATCQPIPHFNPRSP